MNDVLLQIKINSMNDANFYKEEFLTYLNENIKFEEPVNLYKPINYILQIGGKRLRPVLTLMTCDAFDGNVKEAYDAALGVEVFHNFTLVHDDIMDSAPIRRGMETVHKKWDLNTAILSGDAMMIVAYQCFESYEPAIYKKLLNVFNKTALLVCEGQQLDVDFEESESVSIDNYLTMITCKTSVLVAAAMKMGAIIANADEDEATEIYNFGLNLGIAFQLQDDYLDTFGDAEVFGKQIGGDIAENKKTFLYLKALELSDHKDKALLKSLYKTTGDISKKIEIVTQLYRKYQISENTIKEIERYSNKAFDILEGIPMNSDKKDMLKDLGVHLMKRTI